MLKIEQVRTEKDLNESRALLVEYSDSLGIDLCFQNFDQELVNLPGDYAPPSGRLLIAQIDGTIAGCIALRKLENCICEMKRLYVRPQFRGLQIGRALTEAVIAEAREIGYTRMRLDTLPSMKKAQAIYQDIGFKEIPPYHSYPIEGVKFLELEL
jgi:ribosomal protein S18 acetylase RimI-like enzyme